MKDPILRLLRRSDSVDFYQPPGFNALEVWGEIRALRPDLERISDLKLTEIPPETYQDGTALAALSVCVKIPRPENSSAPENTIPLLTIRFSSFGTLFTITKRIDVQSGKFQQILDRISQAGFTYVPWKDLMRGYAGVHPYFKGQTWAKRFFCDAN